VALLVCVYVCMYCVLYYDYVNVLSGMASAEVMRVCMYAHVRVCVSIYKT
jgi:hypothetical protein